jgi:hypothetical protein
MPLQGDEAFSENVDPLRPRETADDRKLLPMLERTHSLTREGLGRCRKTMPVPLRFARTALN